MLLIPLVLLFQQPTPQHQTELVVTSAGAFEVQQDRQSGAALVPGTASALVPPRWDYPDGGLAWIGGEASVGDSGAAGFATTTGSYDQVGSWSTGSPAPLFLSNFSGAYSIQTDVARRSPIAAALVCQDTGGLNLQSTLHVWDTTSSGTSLWSATLPITGNVYAGTVGVSDDGNRIGVAASNANGLLHLRLYDRSGTLLASHDWTASYNLRQGRFDATIDRLYVGLYNGMAHVLDMNLGLSLTSINIASSFDSHAFSADGRTLAYGNFLGLFVHRETTPGVWVNDDYRANPSGSFLSQVDLNDDGSRAAFMVQYYSPGYDRIEVGMRDTIAGTDLSHQGFLASGSAYQLSCDSIAIDAAGERLAAANWGDSFNLTPEVILMDDQGSPADGLDLLGSAFSIDLDADGDVVLATSKAVHANVFGSGGAVTCIDPYEQRLHVSGTPRIGGVVEIQTPSGASDLVVSVCTALGSTATPFGPTGIDLGTEWVRLGPFPVGGVDISVPMAIPNNPSLAGLAVHLQGLRRGVVPELTNKVSLRLLP